MSDSTPKPSSRERVFTGVMVALTALVVIGLCAAVDWLTVHRAVAAAASFGMRLRGSGYSFVEQTDPFLGGQGDPGVHEREFGYMANPRDKKPSATYRATINQLGLRDTRDYTFETVRAIPSMPLVVALGDSSMHGANIDDGGTIPERLEFWLPALRLGPPVRALNAGYVGSNSLANLVRLKRLAPLVRPDGVVFLVSVNDTGDECVEASEARRAFYRALAGLTEDGRPLSPEQGRALVRRHIDAMVRTRGLRSWLFCDKAPFLTESERADIVAEVVKTLPGVPVVFLHAERDACTEAKCPLFERVPAAERARISHFDFLRFLAGIDLKATRAEPRYRQTLENFTRKLAYPGILDEKPFYTVLSDGAGHPNEVGADLIAQEIARRLIAQGLPAQRESSP
jgi:hypothetical protein